MNNVKRLKSDWILCSEGSSNFYPSSFVYTRSVLARFSTSTSLSHPIDWPHHFPPLSANHFNAWTRSDSPLLLFNTPLFPYTPPHTLAAFAHIHFQITSFTPYPADHPEQAWRPEVDQGFQTMHALPRVLHLHLNLHFNHTSPSPFLPSYQHPLIRGVQR